MSDATRPPLTRDAIVSAAIALADANGLAGLSMRKVAAELGYEVMSLYNHVANKTDLLRAMVDQAAGEIETPGDDEPWRPAIRTHAVATKQMFERHPWAVGLWVGQIPGPRRFDHMEWMLATLDRSGLDHRRAHDAFHAIANHVVGYMLSNLAMPAGEDDLPSLLDEVMAMIDPERHRLVLAHINQHLDGDTGPSFEFVLDILIAGIAGD
ncbi:MAG: TetR/AcrR family transcriptional regulator C-terminal domain-containing protein [Actinomycetota bacterium]